jgi:hypothetical protein
MKLRYQSFDGSLHDTEESCRAQDAKTPEHRLVGLTVDDVALAINRADVELADAIEAVGARIARARRDSGVLRRERKADDVKPGEDA